MESKFISDTLSIIIPDMLKNLSRRIQIQNLSHASVIGWIGIHFDGHA